MSPRIAGPPNREAPALPKSSNRRFIALVTTDKLKPWGLIISSASSRSVIMETRGLAHCPNCGHRAFELFKLAAEDIQRVHSPEETGSTGECVETAEKSFGPPHVRTEQGLHRIRPGQQRHVPGSTLSAFSPFSKKLRLTQVLTTSSRSTGFMGRWNEMLEISGRSLDPLDDGAVVLAIGLRYRTFPRVLD